MIKSEIFEKYLKEVSKIKPFINSKEEYDCAIKAFKGDKQAKNTLINKNLRFVISTAKKYRMDNISLEDLVNEGNIGLIKAADKFDPTLGYKFISYAVKLIKSEIFSYLDNNARTIRLPTNHTQGIPAFNKKILKLESKLQREATEADMVAEFSEYSLKRIRELIYLSANNMSSLDVPISTEEGPISRYEYMEDTKLPTIYDIIHIKDRKDFIDSIMSELNDKDKTIMNKYYGLNGEEPVVFKVIGKQFNNTKEAISYRLKTAIKKIQKRYNYEKNNDNNVNAIYN
jgi:RNA polymerase primary sigma factor